MIRGFNSRMSGLDKECKNADKLPAFLVLKPIIAIVSLLQVKLDLLIFQFRLCPLFKETLLEL